ncbi:T9SS type A sorting domain-containing protein [Bacteroidota bacterium]
MNRFIVLITILVLAAPGKSFGQTDPVILGVAIPDTIMKVSDQVTATITVENDHDTLFTLNSGNIGGFLLQNLIRIDSVTYQAEFDIIEGGNDYHETEDIPVTNLQLYNWITPGNIWNQPIIQDNDLLDANTPNVVSATVLSTGKIKIGSEIFLLLTADQPAYEIQDSSYVNNVFFSDPDVFVSDIGNGNYNVRYIIREGDGDVGTGDLTIGIYAMDRAGNINPMFQTLDPNSLSIDANRPIINRAVVSTVDSSIYVDEVVEIIVETDAPGYIPGSGTWINNVSIDESNLTYLDLGDGRYRFVYTIKENDQNVSKGELEVNIVLIDSYSNLSPAFTSLDPNNLEIFTSRPSAVISGSTEICDGDSAKISVSLGGVPPWVIALSDGTDIDIIGDIQESLFEFYVKPKKTTNYTIPLLRDGIDAHNTGIGNALITFFPVPIVEILNLPTEHDILGDPIELQADPEGGIFSGPGVTSSIPVSFYPSVAGTENSPHEIIYSYTDTNGCTSRDAVIVHVIESSGNITFSKPVACFNDTLIIITGSNPSDSIGTFSVQPDMPGALFDSGNNVATLNPLLYDITADLDIQIQYSYVDSSGLEFIVQKTLQIEKLQDATILALDDVEFCNNSVPISLNGNYPGTGIFTGSGVVGSTGEGYVFDPSQAQIGANSVYYTHTSAKSCFVLDSVDLSVYPAPVADFTVPENNCIPISGGTIGFENNSLTGSSSQIEWNWNFDDINSGLANYSDESDPSHFYEGAENKNVTLVVSIDNRCSDSIQKAVEIYPNPLAGFTWTSNCLTTDPITFDGTEQLFSNDSIVGRKWTISNGGTLFEVDTITAEQIQYSFLSAGSYNVFYSVTSSYGCKNTHETEINLSPTILLSEGEYFQDFEKNRDGWSGFPVDGGQNSWVFGDIVGLEFPFIASSGEMAWYTELPKIKSAENSWVQSPCFNFENTDRPMLSIDIKQSLDRDREGVVIQYTDDKGQSWNNIGAVDDGGLNWYNSTKINNGPGEQNIGWTGFEPFAEDKEWQTAAHQVDQLVGKKDIRFRIAYGSTGDDTDYNHGFAFDDFCIKERTRLSLLEYFTNANSNASSNSDQLINDLTNNKHKDVVDIQYHTDFPVADKFNQESPVSASTRGLHYGVSAVPYATMDGGLFDPDLGYDRKYDFISRTPGNKDVSIRSLTEPDFIIKMEVFELLPALQLYISMEATKNIAAKELTLFTVILEKTNENFENIARKILPDAGGLSYNQEWQAGDQENTTVNWDQPYAFLGEDNIAVVVFIQDDQTKEVLQAAKYNIQGVPTSVSGPEVIPGNKIRIYPNPARDLVNIQFGGTITESLWLFIHDFSGRLIRMEEIPYGTDIHSISMADKKPGMYILEFLDLNQTQVIHRKKLLLY